MEVHLTIKTMQIVWNKGTFAPLSPTLVSLERVNMLLVLHSLDIDPPIQILCWTSNLIQSLNFRWTLLGQHFYTCLFCWLVVLLAWASNIFESFLNLRISMKGFINSTNYVPMWLLAASLGPWLESLGLIDFWLYLSLLVASV